MGKRLLRLGVRPSVKRTEIESRLEAVAAATGNMIAREELRRGMEGILDLERLLSRVTRESANPRDMLALAGIVRAATT